MAKTNPKKILQELSTEDPDYKEKLEILTFLIHGLPYTDNMLVIDESFVLWARENNLNVINDKDDDEKTFWACSIE